MMKINMDRKKLLVLFTFFLILPTILIDSPISDHNSKSTNIQNSAGGFVGVSGTEFELDGERFYFAGTNCYYLEYSSQLMVDTFFEDMVEMNLTVVRMWGFLDGGIWNGTDYTNGVDGDKGIRFQYYDNTTKEVVINNGTVDMENLDYAIYMANQSGVKVVMPFTNFWYGMGGIPQYLTWFDTSIDKTDNQAKKEFFTNSTFQEIYRNYVFAILNRTNVYTGVQYKDDPTIMAWELMNEPRYDGGESSELYDWIVDMSSYVKSIDTNHLVSIGDEGMGIGVYENIGNNMVSSDHPDYWQYNYPWGDWEGYNWASTLQIATIDYGSAHLYPDHWTNWFVDSDDLTAEFGIAYGTKWISDHAQVANNIGKPWVLGEFGWQNQSTRDEVFSAWFDAIENYGVAGDMYWMLAANETASELYPDYDGFTVYWDENGGTESTALLIQQHALNMIAKNEGSTPHTPIAPTLNSPADINYEPGSSGNDITWTLTDDNPINFTLLIEGVNNISGTWYSGDIIDINVDGLPLGTYNYTLIIEDFDSLVTEDTVLVIVAEEDGTTTPTNTDTDTGDGNIPGYRFSSLALISLISITIVLKYSRRNKI